MKIFGRPKSWHKSKKVLGKPRNWASYSFWAVAFILTLAVGFAIGTRVQNLSLINLNFSSLNEVYNALNAKYDGKLDKNALIEGAARGMVQAAGDNYTAYMTSDEYRELESEIDRSLSGIGVEISTNQDGQPIILSVFDNTPAAQAGLQSGDRIVSVNGESADNKLPAWVANKIRGEAGSEVKLTVGRAGYTKQFSLKRQKIDIPSVRSQVIDDIGYLDVDTFGNDTGQLVRQAAQQFIKQGVRGVVLDLRGNTGGYVDAAGEVASVWLRQGQVITEERNEHRVLQTVKASGQPILDKTPTVILTNQGTASASEIVAGALRDHLGTKLVGEKTFGKGVVQEVVQLRDGGVLKVTVAKWFTPKGANIHGQGLTPDISQPMTVLDRARDGDIQLKRALELLQKQP